MSNGRAFRRALAAGLMVAAPSVVSMPGAQAGVGGPAQASQPEGPLIWQGTVPGATPDSMVIVHAQPTGYENPEPGTELPVVVVGTAVADDDGVFRVYSDPSSWYPQMADPEGRVQLFVTATGSGGTAIGMSFVNVVYVAPGGSTAFGARNSSSDGAWTLDEAGTAVASADPSPPDDILEEDPGDVARAAPGPDLSLAATRVVGPSDLLVPSTAFAMHAAPVDSDASREGAQARSLLPEGWWCTGGYQVVGYSKPTLVAMARYYHEEFGPNETFRYQSVRSTTVDVGAKIGANPGPLTVTAKASVARTQSEGAMAAATVVPDGKKQRAEASIEMRFRHGKYSGCHLGPPTGSPNPPPGQQVQVILPQEWTGKVSYRKYSIGATPRDDGTYQMYLDQHEMVGRLSGRSSTTSKAFEASVSGYSLTGGASYSTSASQGFSVSRSWTNPRPKRKWIKGYGAHPTFTGVVGVRGF